MKFKYSWRWFGPNDPITLGDIRQTNATGIVTALHHIPIGKVWPMEEILKRKSEIEAAGMSWSVVESVPVHEDIKKRDGDFNRYLENYRQTLKNLAQCGVTTVCYNFMPILDWTRTDLNYQVSTGSYSLRFDTTAFAAFELFILKREGSTELYNGSQISKAKIYFNGLSSHQQQVLCRNIIAGLPGGHVGYTLDEFRLILNEYKHISEADLQTNLRYFLEQVIPTAADAGVNLCIHPDDPPYPILGLPRVVSTQADIERLLSEVDSPNNGITLCTGSFVVRGDNDMVRIARRYANRIHFLHFRSVEVEDNGSFYEAGHLEGDSNIAGVMNALLTSDKLSGDHYIPLRPDHGQKMLDDVSKSTNPGYSCIGRMKGLAELRGLESGLRFASKHIEK